MNMHTPPGLLAARAAGRILRTKDSVGIDGLMRAVEDNHRAVDARLKSIETHGEKSVETIGGLDARMLEIEQKMARRGGSGEPAAPQTWGQQFVDAPELKDFAAQTTRPGRLRMQMKTTLTLADNSAGALSRPTRDEAVLLPRRNLTVRDLLPVLRVNSGSVEYPRQTIRPGAPGMVAETTVKPEAEMAFELLSTPTRVIAHWIPASRQVLEDTPQLAGMIDGEMRYGLALKEEQQLLYGDGTGQNLLGMVPQATPYAAPVAFTGGTSLDTIALAILQTSLADLPADGIVLHPSDWMLMRLLKNSDGDYVLGPPGSNVVPQLFGLPVVPTTAMAAGEFLVGNFRAAGTIYDRWEPRVEVATEHADFFVRNLVAILAEERIGLAVKQPKALVHGEFATTP
ncbi:MULTISPECIES: phage major capsid protein [unclassified Methylobacterium]|uniref:phage major capsid protein n=1 Tax=unclassified Methylobacterium TaxID=2615210 RepID=UPI0005BDD20E|nr:MULTISPECIES: phage major capsid protein [unclassified Methylobacterium]SFU67812.1 phage major capsid protein, HK97 family [Methylobacterium sp. UNCCL125]